MSMEGPTTPNHSRPRSRGFSFGSNKSGGSGAKPKYEESPKDKARRDSFWKGQSKANPNAALNEQQPAVANVAEESTLADLRKIRHNDAYGNEIADPDLCNPTRPRLERPLDTIRSFEKAIDDGYKRRSTHIKQDAETWDQNNQFASRPTSYFGGEYAPSKRPRSSANRLAGYSNGPSPNRQQQPNGGGYYGDQNGHANGRAPPTRTRYGNGVQSDPQTYGQQKPFPQHGYHQSHDTVNTGMTNGSDSTGPWANSTDPSSENSSLDRVTAMNKPQTPMNGYDTYGNGYNGPIMEEQGPNGNGVYPQQNGYGKQNGFDQRDYGQQQEQPQFSSPRQIMARHNSAPMPPQHAVPPPSGGRRLMKLDSGQSGSSGLPPGRLPSTQREPEKKKGWLSRKFSKKN